MNDTNANPNPNPPAPAPSWPAPPPPSAPPAPPVAFAPLPAAPPRMLKNPAAAGFLSIIPGLGHVYLGLYQRAIMFFLVFALTQTFLAYVRHGEVPAGLFLAFWWFFCLIDAVRQAKAINMTGAPESNLLPNEKPMRFSGSLTFGVFLVLVGVFFLADRFFRIDLSFLFEWWPVLLIAFGAWQIFAYWKAKQPREPKSGA